MSPSVPKLLQVSPLSTKRVLMLLWGRRALKHELSSHRHFPTLTAQSSADNQRRATHTGRGRSSNKQAVVPQDKHRRARSVEHSCHTAGKYNIDSHRR